MGPASSQGPCRRQEAQRRRASGSRKRSENAAAGRWSMGHTLRSVRGFQKLGEQGRGSPLGPREGTGPADLQAVRSCICHVSLLGVFNCHSGNRERTHTSNRERLELGPAAGSTGSPVLRLSFLRTRPEGRPHGSPLPLRPHIPAQSSRNLDPVCLWVFTRHAWDPCPGPSVPKGLPLSFTWFWAQRATEQSGDQWPRSLINAR